MSNTNLRIANNCLKLRKLHNMTQEHIANELHISRSSYIALESGKKDFSISIIEKIASIHNVPVDRLFRNSYSNDKFIQLYFYVLDFFNAKGGITKTKFAKLLYLIDFGYYYERKQSISDVEYIHRQFGPVPEPFLSITDDFWASGKINITPLSEGALLIKSLVFNNNYDQLSSEEKNFIKKVCSAWENKSTKEIVNYTHQQKPWSNTKDGEYIPYNLIQSELSGCIYLPYSS